MRTLRALMVVPAVALAMLLSGCDSEGDQEQAQGQVQGQGPLTADQVTAFIASHAALRAMQEKYAAEFSGANNPNAANPFGAVMASIKASQGYDEFETAIEKQGFDDIEEWAAVANRVTMAFMAISLEAQGAQMKAQLDQARKQLEANTSMPPEQKKMMLQQMEASAGMMTGLNVSEADKAAVRPRLGELERVMNRR
jgi:hypothetical protein